MSSTYYIQSILYVISFKASRQCLKKAVCPTGEGKGDLQSLVQGHPPPPGGQHALSAP